MNIVQKIILITLVGVASPLEAVSPRKLNEKQLRALQSKIKLQHGLKVEFDQRVFLQLRKRTRKQQGFAHFARPDKFYWVFEKPRRQEYIYDGTTLVHFSPADKIAQRYASASRLSWLKEIVDVVLNFDALLEKYKILGAERLGDKVTVELAPKVQNNEIKKINLEISQKKKYIQFVKFYFKRGDSLAFAFKNPIFGRQPANTFLFKLPPGVKITEIK